MKRVLISIIFLTYSIVGISATITWDGGGGDGLWATAANWVGDVVPGPSDNVVLDNSSLAGNYTVTLPNTAVTIISLRIVPATTPLPNLISLVLPNTNTITSNAFVTTGTGYTVIIDYGGYFVNKANVSSGTNLTIADSFRINNGGQYSHQTRSGHASWVQRLSKIAGTENGLFLFDVPAASYIVSLSGRTYGQLVFEGIQQGGPVTYSGNGASPLTVNGQLLLENNATLSLSLSADVILHDNLNIASSSTFNLQNSNFNNVVKLFGYGFSVSGTITKTGTGIPQLQFCGTNTQSVYVDGNFTNSIEFNINNSAGVRLWSPVTLPYKLILTNGNILTTSTYLLTMVDNATCSGGSINSFVNGPMKKIGDDNFVFPIGFGDVSGNIYAPLGITNAGGEALSDEFTAEYKRANPQSTSPYSSAHDPFLDHVSYAEYWTLRQGVGTSTKQVSLDVHLASFCKDLSKTYVSRWNGSQWTYEPMTITNGPNVLGGGFVGGTIQSNAGISGFTVPNIGFTLATDLSFTNNPLPITLISFDATKLTNTKSSINWELAACCSAAAKFEIQRADANKNFTTIGTIGGSETNKLYNYIDNDLKNGVNYYRLKMIDEDGKITYSRTVAVMNGVNGLLLTSLIPTMVTNTAALTVASFRQQKLDIVIVDVQGRVMLKRSYSIIAGNTGIKLQLAGLGTGVYQLTGISAEGKTNTIRFIRQ